MFEIALSFTTAQTIKFSLALEDFVKPYFFSSEITFEKVTILRHG